MGNLSADTGGGEQVADGRLVEDGDGTMFSK